MRGLLGRSVNCDGCGICLVDYSGRMANNGPICSSIVCGSPSDIDLCQQCSLYEFHLEEERGTNDIPELVKSYMQNRNS